MSQEYKIKPNEEFIDPEETLMDSVTNLSNIERPISNSIFSVFMVILIGVLAVYFINIVNLQVFSWKKFREMALQNISLNYFIPLNRGVIYDRQGKELAYNIPDFELFVVSKYIPADSEGIENFKKNLSAAAGKSIGEIDKILELRKNDALISIEKGLDRLKAIKISQLKLPGVYVLSVPKRFYAEGPYFSHIIGYTGKISPSDLQSDGYYKLQDRKGRIGIESFYEDVLRGEHGIINFSRASSDNNLKLGSPGNNLVLNIDSEVQKHLYLSVSKTLKSAGLSRAAAIVQNPQNGKVMGMVSFPSYDNNLFQEELTDFDAKEIFQNKNKPLLNRIIAGLYNPGSTIKPLLALAALKEKIITTETAIIDNKGYITVKNQYDPNIVYTYRDWKIQGVVNLRKALAHSSDIFFYSVGGGYGPIDGLGISKIASYLKQFLANDFLKIDLRGERSGFIPTESWKLTNKGESWYVGDTYNVSIGQGDLVITPLWINTYISAIANGGDLFKPQIAQKIVDQNKKTIKIFDKEKLAAVDFNKETIEEVKRGMREAVISGTGWLLADLPVQIAAKTGTAEVVKNKKSNSLITLFAPYQDPEIAMTIIIENINQNQQGLALQTAKEFLGWYYASK